MIEAKGDVVLLLDKRDAETMATLGISDFSSTSACCKGGRQGS